VFLIARVFFSILKLFVTEKRDFVTGFPYAPFFGHYVYRFVHIQGIIWISIVENFGDNVKNSAIAR